MTFLTSRNGESTENPLVNTFVSGKVPETVAMVM